MALNYTHAYCNFGNGSSTGYYAVPQWATGHAYTVGNLVRQLAAPAAFNERVFICGFAGTSNATTEPTWSVANGSRGAAQPSDNGVLWWECTGKPPVNGDVTNTLNWLAVKNTNPGAGAIIKNGTADHYFLLTTAGQTGNGSEPTWNTTTGATTADNTCTWTCIGAVGSFSAWGAPEARIGTLANATLPSYLAPAALIDFYVAAAHTETYSAGTYILTLSTAISQSWNITCVAGTHAPPSSGDETTGASLTVTGANNLSIGGSSTWTTRISGITFSCGSVANNVNLNIGSNSQGGGYYKNCNFTLATTNGAAFIGLISTNSGGAKTYENCTFKLAAAAQAIPIGLGKHYFRNCSLIDGTGTQPTNVFVNGGSNNSMGNFIMEGCDLSNITGKMWGSNITFDGACVFKDCKMPSTFPFNIINTQNSNELEIIVENCDSGATSTRNEKWNTMGTMTTSTTVVRTGGFSDAGTPVSRQIVTTNASVAFPMDSFPAAIFNSKTVQNVTVTMFGIINAAAVPNNDDFWIEVEYRGTSASPRGTWGSSFKADYVTTGAALTADSTSAWDSAASARINSHTYAVGDVIKLASNPGRIFFCTASSGNTAASEPGGYATAVDGGSVTDGSATFRAGCRFSCAAVLSSPQPQFAGYLSIQPKMAKPSTTLLYDPLPTLS